MFILDHTKGVAIDPAAPPFSNYHALEQNIHGLHLLASFVRNEERRMIATDPPGVKVFMLAHSDIHPAIASCFNWFSVTLANHLRLVALIDLMNTNKWSSSDLTDGRNSKLIKTSCASFVEDACQEIYKWRNKVAAHYSATDPKNDNLGTIEQSIMDNVTFHTPYLRVGEALWNTNGECSQLPSWSLTEVYDRLCPRFWPEFPLPPVASST